MTWRWPSTAETCCHHQTNKLRSLDSCVLMDSPTLICREGWSNAGEWILPVQPVGQICTERSGQLQASECCLCSQLAGDAHRSPVECRWVNVACTAGWLEMCRVVQLTAGRWMLPVQQVGQRSAERSGRLWASECCQCSWLAGDAQSGPVNCMRVNAVQPVG
jgi:hypothetical protein